MVRVFTNHVLGYLFRPSCGIDVVPLHDLHKSFFVKTQDMSVFEAGV
jgi:hypothetical protein